MLVNAGNREDDKTILSYLSKQKVKRLDVLVGTHPHEDHIGGMATIIKTLDIGKIYMPKVSTTTRTFENTLLAIKNKGLKVTPPVAGSPIQLDPAIKVTILAPNSPKYEDLNNYSIVLKIVYGEISFLLTGDAERESENEMLAKGYDLRAQILKIGHHGSKSSSSAKFLDAVKPKVSVISVGQGNDYGHPAPATVKRLEKYGVVYRTDQYGTVVLESEGISVRVGNEK